MISAKTEIWFIVKQQIKITVNKMIEWNDYGESSLTLLAVHNGIRKKEPNYPYDPADFRRCIHLFDCLGFDRFEGKALVNKTATKYKMWIPFAKHWDELVDLYLIERDEPSAPRLYDKLISCRKEINSTNK